MTQQEFLNSVLMYTVGIMLLIMYIVIPPILLFNIMEKKYNIEPYLIYGFVLIWVIINMSVLSLLARYYTIPFI